jgi:hypothetical protein
MSEAISIQDEPHVCGRRATSKGGVDAGLLGPCLGSIRFASEGRGLDERFGKGLFMHSCVNFSFFLHPSTDVEGLSGCYSIFGFKKAWPVPLPLYKSRQSADFLLSSVFRSLHLAKRILFARGQTQLLFQDHRKPC